MMESYYERENKATDAVDTDESLCVGFGVLVSLLLVVYFRSRQTKLLPPTPGLALPFVGHLYLLKKNPRPQLRQWADKYGDVFRLQMGPETIVFVNTFEAMKEAFVKKADHFSDRSTRSFLAKHSDYFTKGVATSSDAQWKIQRTVSLNILRKFGMGKNILCEKILEEISYYIKELIAKNGEPLELRHLTNMSVSNVISSIIFGKRFEFQDQAFNDMLRMFDELVEVNTGTLPINYIYSLFYLPFDLFKGKKLVELMWRIRDFTSKKIKEIKECCVNENSDNYILAYVEEMKKSANPSESARYLTEENLNRNIDNLFTAGSETTSTTILWSLLYALNYPDVQKKIYYEIVEHVGMERSPKMIDKPKLKYLTAFIMEVQRKASIAPLSLPHFCRTESTIAGYTIPEGTTVMPHLDAVHCSKEIWGDPENFRPERFLDEQGNIIKREELIPFSIGRRVCLGESLARMELFLYLSTLFQKFEFLPPSPDEVPPLNETFGVVVVPKPFHVRCVTRN